MFFLELLTIPAMVAINRGRGNGEWHPWLKARSMYLVFPLVAPVAYVLLGFPLLAALACALGFLCSTGPWGRWLSLGRLPTGWNRVGIEPNFHERVVMAIAKPLGGSDHACLGVLLLLGILPLLAALVALTGALWLAALALPYAALMVASYEIAWRSRPEAPLGLAEGICGGVWGVLLIAAKHISF